MGSDEKPSPTSSSSSREKMVKELIKGKKFAKQLQILLQKPFEEDGNWLVSADDLVFKILQSFTHTLSQLTTTSCDDDDDDDDQKLELQQQQQQQANSCNVSSDDHYRRRSKDSGETKKKRPAALKNSVTSNKRGCYKRKKNSQTLTVVTSTINDSYAWRKYGQKEILNAKFPRSYFRCTHKYVQGCRATKQVQRIDDDPENYEIAYIGHHTCRDIISFPQIVAGDQEINSDDQPNNWTSTTSTISSTTNGSCEEIIKHDECCKEETTSCIDNHHHHHHHHHQEDYLLSSLDSIVWEDIVSFQSSDESASAAAADMMFSCDDNYNSKMNDISSHSLELDMYNDFEHGFHFDDESHHQFF